MYLDQYKNIFVSGCSFTAGHNLLDVETWPYKLAENLNLKLTSTASNGGSLDMFVDSATYELTKFNPKDTLVAIGLTWPERFAIRYGKGIINISGGDLRLGKTKTSFLDKLAKQRRLQNGGYDDYNVGEAIEIIRPIIQGDRDETIQFQGYTSTINKYREAFQEHLTWDIYFTENRRLNSAIKVTLLQEYFKSKGFKYLFVQFPHDRELWPLSSIKDSIDMDKVIKIPANEFCGPNGMVESHPGAECCTDIAKLLESKFKEVWKL